MKIQDIARICHQANKAYCEGIGDTTQLDWESAPQWQRDSAVQGVKFVLGNLDAPASASHDAWVKDKVADGWQYGPVKDPALKTHPCIVPYDQLPPTQRGEDYLFMAVVKSIYSAALIEPA